VPKLKDYYEILGIPHRSHVRLIEESYWEQAHELKKTPTRRATKKLEALNEAYEVLGTPHKRMKYDGQWAQSDVGGNGARQSSFLQHLVNLLSRPFRPD
jgi:curved DNA-binding protein CbpA